MKKIYITAVPLDSNFILEAQEIECVNIDLRADDQLTFPISRLMQATMQPDDEALVITVRQVNEYGEKNMDSLKQDLAALQAPYRLKDITTPENQNKSDLMELFKRLAKTIEPQTCIYADSTFGTKSYPIVLLAALNYAEKIKECELKKLIYQEQRREPLTHKPIGTYLYDVTALYYLNGIVDALHQSDAGVEEKESLLDTLLNL